MSICASLLMRHPTDFSLPSPPQGSSTQLATFSTRSLPWQDWPFLHACSPALHSEPALRTREHPFRPAGLATSQLPTTVSTRSSIHPRWHLQPDLSFFAMRPRTQMSSTLRAVEVAACDRHGSLSPRAEPFLTTEVMTSSTTARFSASDPGSMGPSMNRSSLSKSSTRTVKVVNEDSQSRHRRHGAGARRRRGQAEGWLVSLTLVFTLFVALRLDYEHHGRTSKGYQHFRLDGGRVAPTAARMVPGPERRRTAH